MRNLDLKLSPTRVLRRCEFDADDRVETNPVLVLLMSVARKMSSVNLTLLVIFV